MVKLLIGYMLLFVYRPFEIWPWLGSLRIERIYMAGTILYWALVQKDKTWSRNRLQYAFAFFVSAFLLAWLASPYDTLRQQEVVENYLKVLVFFFLVLTT